jgi:hypothetical protein
MFVVNTPVSLIDNGGTACLVHHLYNVVFSDAIARDDKLVDNAFWLDAVYKQQIPFPNEFHETNIYL